MEVNCQRQEHGTCCSEELYGFIYARPHFIRAWRKKSRSWCTSLSLEAYVMYHTSKLSIYFSFYFGDLPSLIPDLAFYMPQKMVRNMCHTMSHALYVIII